MCLYNVFTRWTVKFTLFLYCNFLVLLSTTVCSQNINKQIVNIADENLTDYSFLSRYHSKSKNYLKRRYRIRHWITMFIGTPCMWLILILQNGDQGTKAKSDFLKYSYFLDEYYVVLTCSRKQVTFYDTTELLVSIFYRLCINVYYCQFL